MFRRPYLVSKVPLRGLHLRNGPHVTFLYNINAILVFSYYYCSWVKPNFNLISQRICRQLANCVQMRFPLLVKRKQYSVKCIATYNSELLTL